MVVVVKEWWCTSVKECQKIPPQTTVPSGMVALASTVTMPERM